MEQQSRRRSGLSMIDFLNWHSGEARSQRKHATRYVSSGRTFRGNFICREAVCRVGKKHNYAAVCRVEKQNYASPLTKFFDFLQALQIANHFDHHSL